MFHVYCITILICQWWDRNQELEQSPLLQNIPRTYRWNKHRPAHLPPWTNHQCFLPYDQSSLGGDTLRVYDSWSEGPGLGSCISYFSVDAYQWCLTGLSKAWWCAQNGPWLRAPKISLGFLYQRCGLSPSSVFLSGTEMFVNGMKGDFIHQSINNTTQPQRHHQGSTRDPTTTKLKP